MKTKFGQNDMEKRRLTILRRLAPLGTMNMLEMGFNATPQAIRNMAAAGLVKVTVQITARGVDTLAALELKDLRGTVNARKKARMAPPAAVVEAA